MILSYKYRVEPNKTQAKALGEMLGDFCKLYNCALEQRIDACRRRGVSLRYKDQANELKVVRLAEPDLARWSFSAEQQVLRRLEKTFSAFFARGRCFPRFRARDIAEHRRSNPSAYRQHRRSPSSQIASRVQTIAAEHRPEIAACMSSPLWMLSPQLRPTLSKTSACSRPEAVFISASKRSPTDASLAARPIDAERGTGFR